MEADRPPKVNGDGMECHRAFGLGLADSGLRIHTTLQIGQLYIRRRHVMNRRRLQQLAQAPKLQQQGTEFRHS